MEARYPPLRLRLILDRLEQLPLWGCPVRARVRRDIIPAFEAKLRLPLRKPSLLLFELDLNHAAISFRRAKDQSPVV
jgi:hypothetical protein